MMYKTVKRISDIIFSLILLLVLSPILIICFIAVKINSPGPAIFKQTRLCKDGKEFTMYKFRSMYIN
jgi:lipopolysaccharide/colanic/teichoic acid biosynthesis glycosyltransferase